MKKMLAWSILLALLAVCAPVLADSTDAEPIGLTAEQLGSMSIGELLTLRDMIDLALQEKGYVVYLDISHGDKGDHVTKLQERLTELGYYSGKISGKYDNATEKAVKQFEKANGLEVSGVATTEMQQLLYSAEEGAVVSATPKPTAEPAPTDDPAFAEYAAADYEECARYPEKYMNTKVKLVGKVMQVLGSRDKGFEIRLATSGSDDIYYISIPKGMVDFNILEDDRLTVYAVMKGLYTYTSTMNKSITIPYATADNVILR